MYGESDNNMGTLMFGKTGQIPVGIRTGEVSALLVRCDLIITYQNDALTFGNLKSDHLMVLFDLLGSYWCLTAMVIDTTRKKKDTHTHIYAYIYIYIYIYIHTHIQYINIYKGYTHS